jgi:hypothetical protein
METMRHDDVGRPLTSEADRRRDEGQEALRRSIGALMAADPSPGALAIAAAALDVHAEEEVAAMPPGAREAAAQRARYLACEALALYPRGAF